MSSPGHSWQEAAGGIVAGTAAAAEVRPIEAAAVVVGIHSLVAVEEVAGSRIGAFDVSVLLDFRVYALFEKYSLLLVAISLLGRRMGAVVALSWISHIEGVCSCGTRKCSRWHRV